MTEDHFTQVKALFLAAIELDGPSRSAMLDQECVTPALRSRVEALLRAHDSPSFQFLSKAPDLLDEVAGPGQKLGMGPGDTIGEYRVLKHLGGGGFGEVWLAENPNLHGRQVAVKVIKPGMDTREVLARFAVERRVLTLMLHHNIAAVLDAGVTDRGRPYFVMEYVDGLTLAEHCRARRSTLHERLELFLAVCSAIEYAHQRPIIHRDLKPQNILVEARDGRAIPKVIDFGMAKAIFGEGIEDVFKTQSGGAVGTPDYMAPEQTGRLKLDVDTRADVYSLGAILYELLTGTTPLNLRREGPRLGFPEIAVQICETEPTRPRERARTNPELPWAGSLPRDLDWIAMKAMEKDRDRRYPSVGELAADVRRFLRVEPVQAAPPDPMYRLARFVRRHRRGLALASVLGLMLVGGLIAIGAAARRADRQAERARLAEREREWFRAHVDGQREFILDALEAIRPSIALGRDTTMFRAVLESSSEQIRRGNLQAAPDAELEIRLVLGESYREIADYARAREMLDPTLQLARSIDDSEQTRVAAALEFHAWLLHNTGDHAQAIRQLEEVLAIRKAAGRVDEGAVAKTMFHIGDCLRGLGRLEDALAQHQAALALRRRIYPERHHLVAVSLSNTGIVHLHLFQQQDALACFEEARDIFREHASGESLDLALATNNIATCLADLGRVDEAIGLQRQALASFYRLHYGDHPNVAQGLSNLASCLDELGHHEEALTQYQAALAMCERLYPGDHAQTAMLHNNIGVCLSLLGRPAHALPHKQTAFDMMGRIAAEDDPTPWHFLGNLASTLQAVGQLDQAADCFDRAIAELQARLPGNHPLIGRLQSNYGACLTLLGRFAAAAVTLEAAQVVLEANPDFPAVYQRENLERLVRLFEQWDTQTPAGTARAVHWRARLAALSPEPPTAP